MYRVCSHSRGMEKQEGKIFVNLASSTGLIDGDNEAEKLGIEPGSAASQASILPPPLFSLQHNVEAWPTFKLFREGRAYEYVGPMNKDQMIEYMKEQDKSPSDEKTTFTSESPGPN